MLYTTYKTTNMLNGKYYFGVHKTDNPTDSYLGSGKYIKAAIAKHGEQSLCKEVLFIYLDPSSAFAKEDELIQCYRGFDPLCMNLRKGGSGGFDWINSQPNHHLNLLGQRFGRLVVTQHQGSTKRGLSLWSVHCDCGVQKTVLGSSLTSDGVHSCGTCLKIDDLSGQQFGNLFVIKYISTEKRFKSAEWLCQCNCGVKKIIPAALLKNGDTISCGCSHPKRLKDLTGHRFGNLTVISRCIENALNGHAKWLVQCDCGSPQKQISGDSLRSGHTRSCGCIRRQMATTLYKTRLAAA